MRRNRQGWRLACPFVAWFAINAFMIVTPSDSFGQLISEFLCQRACNPGSLNLCTPSPCKARHSLEIGGIWLAPSTPDSQELAYNDIGDVLLNADQLQGDMNGGIDATFKLFNVLKKNEIFDFQMRYFQVGDMEANRTVSNENPITDIFFQGFPVNPVNSYDFNSESRIRSFESNLVVRTPFRLSLLGGFRYVEIDEAYNVFDYVTDPNIVYQALSRADNTMAGGQIGAEGTLLSRGRGRILGSFKWAWLSNDVVGSATADNAFGNRLQADARDTISSQLLDFQLGGSINIPYVVLYVGYQGLVASDIALALEQNRNASLFVNTNPVFTSDSQWHGLKFTSTIMW